MKNIFVLLTICSILLMVTPISADDNVRPIAANQLAPAEILTVHASLIPVYFLWMTTLHEGSHALVLAASGVKIDNFKPYPHYTRVISGHKQLAFGEITWIDNDSMTRTQAALRSAAPMINDIALFVSADLLLSYAAIQNPWTQTFIFFGGMACPLIDFAMNLYSQNSESDYNRLRRALNLPRNALPIVGNILIFLAGWRMIYHGQIIFFGHTAKNGSRHHFILVPTSDSAPLGFTLTGTF